MTVHEETPMRIDDPQVDVNREPAHVERVGVKATSDSPRLAMTGLSVIHPVRAPLPYSERWFRAWESDLHRRAVRTTGRRNWDLSRFSVDGGPDAAKAGCRETHAAVAQAAKQAMAASESNCGRRSSRERLALVYFDFWGQCSHLEQAMNWRDNFDLDVIPKFLLRDHGVNAYSCKIQAGRTGFIQGLRVASELLNGGDVDSVLLGGVFRFYPALGFSEALGNTEQERRWLGRGGQHNAAIVERAGFVVLKSEETAFKAKIAPVMIGTPHYRIIVGSREAAAQRLCEAWSTLLPEATALIYGGLYPSSLLADVETSASVSMKKQLAYENICLRFGDSGGVNPLLALQHFAEQKAADTASAAAPALMSLSESDGATWLLRCE